VIYGAYGYDEAIDRDPNSLSYVAEPVQGTWLLAMDPCKYLNNLEYPETSGAFSVETLAWILEKLQEAEAQGKTVIGFMHHGITEHFVGQTVLFPEYVIDDWPTVSATLASAGLQIVFTGHYHSNDITLSTAGGNDLYDVETGSLVTYPCPIRFVTLLNGEAAISSEFIESIPYDTGGVPFPEYAYDYIFQGLQGIAITMLMDLGLDEPTAQTFAPYVAEAFIAHYAGDESPSPEALAFIDTLLNSGDQLLVFFGQFMGSVYTDLPPADTSGVLPMPPSVYEDAEDGDTLGWSIYDQTPSGATVSNVIDSDRGSRVIELSGTGTSNGYLLTNEDGSPWNNQTQFLIEWSMKCTSEVRVFVDVETTAGQRFLYYSTVDTDNGVSGGVYVHHGLGSDVMDDDWHTFLRDLQADLNDFQPGVTITAVNGMYIRGSASFDDIRLWPSGTIFLSIDDVSIDEGAGAAQFNITASDTSTSEITVAYDTIDGTAEAGFDYVTSTGTATIGAGSASVNVSVTILEDTEEEDDQTFLVTLSSPTNAAIFDGTGVGTIEDNDGPPITVYEER
jgi:hypothetical protein